MTERDKQAYHALKSDPVKYAIYLERKRAERKERQDARSYETKRKQQWREKNRPADRAMRCAHFAVERAIKAGRLVRPKKCFTCKKRGKVEAHHHRGYGKVHRLDVLWLCPSCHRKAEK